MVGILLCVYRSEKSVKLPYSNIPKEGVRLGLRGEDAPWEGLAELSLETAPNGHLFVQKQGRNVLVEGEVRAALWFECSRCMERFLHAAELSVQQVLRPKGRERVEAKEVELHAEDLEFGSYDEENIPLADVVEEHLLLFPWPRLGVFVSFSGRAGRRRVYIGCSLPANGRTLRRVPARMCPGRAGRPSQQAAGPARPFPAPGGAGCP